MGILDAEKPKRCVSDKRLRLNLWGTISLRDERGRDRTPRLAKCQAILALLATAKDGVRTRSWLQSKLWSDRSKDQANGSLRQALADIRKTLGASKDILTSNRQRVTLDLERIDFAPRQTGDEFLAGLDVRDEEFEDWLRVERAHRETTAPPRGLAEAPQGFTSRGEDPVVVLTGGADRNEALSTIKVFLIDTAARSLREHFAIRTFTDAPPPASSNTLVVELSTTLGQKGRIHLAARCLSSDRKELIWSGGQNLKLEGAFPFEDLDVLAWVNEFVAAIADIFGRRAHGSPERRSATHLGLTALRELFSLDATRVARAEGLLREAYEADPRSVFAAWLAQLKAIQMVERHTNSPEALREEGLELARWALEQDPSNASIFATLANARLILAGDAMACDTLSRMSVELNPANPLGWWSRAFSFLYSGRPNEALAASEKGYLLARGSPFRFWWEMQTALSATAAHKFDRAIMAAERSAVMGTDCRPSMRYLVGLHARQGNAERASHWAGRLAKLEPDFTPGRLVADGEYPASLLRRYEVVTAEQLKPVSAHLARPF